MPQPLVEDIIRLCLAVGVGALIGAEREYSDKSAGFRTIIMICTGAALFTIFSVRIGGEDDPTRIAANIVSGVGFLGAGAILRDGGRLVGLTTASTIWLTAALGMGIGGGQLSFVLIATMIILLILWVFPTVERFIDNLRDRKVYQVVCALNTPTAEQVDAILRDTGLRIYSVSRSKKGERMLCTWVTVGSPKKHTAASAQLLAHPGVEEFQS